MSDIDLVAIRARDQGWTDRGRRVDSTGRDRRSLLDYIDELESLMVEIAADVRVIKRMHRDHYVSKPIDPQEIEALDRELAAEQAENIRAGHANFLKPQAPGKLPP